MPGSYLISRWRLFRLPTDGTTRGVLYLAWAPFFSGAERALLLTLQSLDPSRYVPYVLAGTDGEFAAQVRQLGITCDVAHLRPFENRHPLKSARSIAAVLAAALRHRVALIHANDVPSFQPGGYAARLLGIPSVTHVRFPDSAAGYQWFLRSRFSRALFVSHDLQQSAIAEAPALFTDRSSVLHDWVEPQPSWTLEDVHHCRRELALPTDRVIVAMAGQVAEVKGIWDFVEAAHILAARGHEPFFAVLGDDLKTGGCTRRAMEARVEALGLESRFKFLGYRRDAPRVVQAFDVIAVPSLVEPLGNATLEAMAAGRPVVGSRVGGIPEMVVPNETGVLVPPATPLALADALERLVGDDGLRRRMSANARRRASELFGKLTHGGQLQEHYDALMTTSTARRPVERQLA
jgi:glycosyltransferase involved in cell wall biosynthesis